MDIYQQVYNFDKLLGDPISPLSTPTCKNTIFLREEDITKVPKFVEGILVGGNILVMLFAGCGNIAALIIVLKSRAPKLATKYFLGFLALSDLLMTVTAPPPSISKLMNDFGAWIFGKVLCKLVPCLQFVAATMSALCLMAIAIERNLLIVRAMNPTSVTVIWETWIAPVLGVAVIIIPIACGLPTLWYYEHITFIAIPRQPPTQSPPENVTTTMAPPSTSSTEGGSSNHSSCEFRHYCMRTRFDRRNIIHNSLAGSTYLCLLLCFLVCYISIFRFVKKHGDFRKDLVQQRQARLRQLNPTLTLRESKFATADRHRKSLRLILGLIFLNLCCRLPNWIFLIVINVVVVPTTEGTMTLLESLQFLSCINSALNPFFYVIWNHSIRATLDKDGGGGGAGTAKFGMCADAGRRCKDVLLSICSCGRYKRESIGGEGGNMADPNMKHKWSWRRNGQIFNVKPSTGNDGVKSVSTQRVFYSDKSY